MCDWLRDRDARSPRLALSLSATRARLANSHPSFHMYLVLVCIKIARCAKDAATPEAATRLYSAPPPPLPSPHRARQLAVHVILLNNTIARHPQASDIRTCAAAFTSNALMTAEPPHNTNHQYAHHCTATLT